MKPIGASGAGVSKTPSQETVLPFTTQLAATALPALPRAAIAAPASSAARIARVLSRSRGVGEGSLEPVSLEALVAI
jgi:hypothetical protein